MSTLGCGCCWPRNGPMEDVFRWELTTHSAGLLAGVSSLGVERGEASGVA